MVLSKTDGKIASYQFKNTELLKEGFGPKPDFWRAPTDNDFGNQMTKRNINWKKVTMAQKLLSIELLKEENGSFKITVAWELTETASKFTTIYTINSDGSIRFLNQLTASASEKSDIPRIGMNLCLPATFNQLTWFGRGPWENYNDRNVSSFVDLYKSTAAEQMIPYLRPQENGSKTEIRWTALTNTGGTGLMAISNNPGKGFEMTAMPYLTEDFDARKGYDYGPVNLEQKHPHDVIQRNLVRWNIDLGQRGLGSVDSWGSTPLEKYQFKPDQAYTYGFTLVPVENATAEKLTELSKKY